jgi:cysteine synthase/glycine/D-amino acid oxidase-like deaminating enzyme
MFKHSSQTLIKTTNNRKRTFSLKQWKFLHTRKCYDRNYSNKKTKLPRFSKRWMREKTSIRTTLRRRLNCVQEQPLSLCGNTQVSYLENTFSEETIKNNDEVFRDLLFNQVGNTPLVEIEDSIFGKLEGHNPGGSLKDRTLSSILLHMMCEGKLRVKGDTVCLVTSGSAGVSLKSIHEQITSSRGVQFDVVVVIPKAYAHKSTPSMLTEQCGPNVYYSLEERNLAVAADKKESEITGEASPRFDLIYAEGLFIDVLAEYQENAKMASWVMLEQHYDSNSMLGHRSTANEILQQCPDVTDVVVSTGTGATAAGLRKFLPNSVSVHSRPAESGTIEGLTDVKRYNNFCNPASLEGYETCVFGSDDAEACREDLRNMGIEAGASSGATFWLARQISRLESDSKARKKQKKIVAICADGKVPTQFISASRANQKQQRRQSPQIVGQRRNYTSSTRQRQQEVIEKDYIIVGGGPVGASTAWFLTENGDADKDVLLIHDPKNKGAHEDWSRLARLSFDGPQKEMDLSRHAIELIDLIDEVRSMQSGAPIVPVRPGMLFLASPGTNMAKVCKNGELYGDEQYVQRSPDELEDIFPGNKFNLPADTLCWTHPTGLCVSPLELASAARRTAEAYGAEIQEGRATIDVSPTLKDGGLRVTLEDGRAFDTYNCFLFAGAQNKNILNHSLQRDPIGNSELLIPEFNETYITAISTIRYKHVNHPATPAPGSGHVPPPITLGQLEIPDLINFQANFSIVAEEYGDVLKTRLSGDVGSETIDTVSDMYKIDDSQNEEMASTYENFFGNLFPFLDTTEPLDFNRCVTYRNHNPNFSGTSIVEKNIFEKGRLLTTVGCFGVGVKFGPALGECASAHILGNEVEEGMNVFTSGDSSLDAGDDNFERVERAW